MELSELSASEKVKELNVSFAGEMSGHIFFKDRYYGFDDALYAAIRFLDLLVSSDQSAAALLDNLPQMCSTPEVRFEVSEARKFDVIDEVKERLAVLGLSVNAVDGVRVLQDEGWWLLRASNTQNALVCRCEASNNDDLMRLQASVRKQLRLSGIDAQIF